MSPGSISSLASIIGWAVICAVALATVCALWWLAGELIYRALPERFREALFFTVPQPRWGDYIPPGATPLGIFVMAVLGGPAKWPRLPSIIAATRKKRAIAEREA